MALQIADGLLPPAAAAATCFAVTAGLIYYFFYHGMDKSKSVLPRAPVGMFETVKGLGGDQAPFWMLATSQKMGSAMNFHLSLPLPNVNIVVADHQLVREILQDPSTDKPRSVYKAFEAMGTTTMFTSANGPYMKSLRKSTAHAFSRNEVGRMNQVARRRTEEWISGRLDEFCRNGETFDPAHEINLVTFLVICEAAFEYQATPDEFKQYEHNAEIATREFIGKAPLNPLRSVFGRFIPEVRNARQAHLQNLEFATKVLKTYRDNPSKSSANTLIKILSANKSIADDLQRRTEMNDWLTAGHDTTGYSIASALVLLASNPKVQSKLRDCLLQHPDKDNLHECAYFRHVMKEAMRVMPVAAGGSVRVTGREFRTCDNKVIPSGAICFFNQYLMNHNPKVYDNATAFLPDRWEDATDGMKTAMAPFALGSRACPGQSLAMAEINMLLPRLLTAYSFQVVHEGEKQFFLTLKYKGARLKATKL